ncbi:MAG: hypothetical protein JXB49_31785 [Bacteroidales bacterium]|nr:hypothetical protein [Bacteroidales bacterium]
MKIRFYIIAILLLGSTYTSYSQQWKLRRYELMIGVGTANCFGELGGSIDKNGLLGLKDLDIMSTRPSLYLGGRYKIRQDISIQVHNINGVLNASDIGSRNEGRNFKFNGFINEFAVMGEYNFIREESKYKSSASFNRRGMVNNYTKMSVYVTGGLGVTYFNPKLTGDFRETDVVDGYSKVALAVPLGIGVKQILSSKWSIGAELGGRYTTTDFLDGIQTQASSSKDIYYFANFNLIYRVKTDRFGKPHLFR